MKKFLCMLMLLGSAGLVNGQKALSNVENISFYGVDFSQAKTVGAADLSAQLKNAFSSINTLFISEAKKYDLGKFLNKKEVGVNLKMIEGVNALINEDEIKIVDNKYVVPKKKVAEMVESYKIDEKDGVGLVMIASLLDKGKDSGSYYVVFFDNKTRNIIYSDLVEGKAGGFGLRNYWAATVYNVLKEWNPKKR